MFKKLPWLLLVLVAAVQAAAPDVVPSVQELRPLQQQPLAAQLTAKLLGRYHYSALPLDDALSAKILDRYLKALDADKLFFVQADIDQWAEARTKIDDAIRDSDLNLPFAIFNLYSRRVTERFTYARSLLENGFDFQLKESYGYQRDKLPWAGSEAELRDLWRKRVKNDWLQLKLAGRDDRKIRETLDKRYENFVRRIGKLRSEDAFQIFMNAYTSAVEPHTGYLGPRASEDFGISMRLSLVGIGATLQDKDDYTTIKELVPGGPAALSGKLKPGDRIVGVAQGDQGPMTDVVGWRIDDTVTLIRGAADSVVRLDVLPAGVGPDGKHEVVSLVRKKITLEEQAAKKSIVSVADAGTTRRIGVIALPTFYEDFEARKKGDRAFKSATRDVARLLNELKADKVDGVLVDLRNNGGGSLSEAIDLTGLFIDTGPVVQQRDARGRVSIANDTNRGTAWDGPLGVLINRGSASASEIFAAAMQDYRRGIVIGEPSFGKGTVQTMVNLNQTTSFEQPLLGEVKLTIAQFFRIDGTTTQLRGVQPDIRLPTMSDAEHFGESSYDNPLPWMRIPSTDYQKIADFGEVLPIVQQRHDARVAKDKDYRNLLEDVTESGILRKRNEISLNEAERRKERERIEARANSRQAGGTAPKKLAATDKPSAVTNELTPEDDDLEVTKARKNANDLLLNEAVHVVGDAAGLLEARPALAAQTPAGGLSTAQ